MFRILGALLRLTAVACLWILGAVLLIGNVVNLIEVYKAEVAIRSDIRTYRPDNPSMGGDTGVMMGEWDGVSQLEQVRSAETALWFSVIFSLGLLLLGFVLFCWDSLPWRRGRNKPSSEEQPPRFDEMC